MVSDALKYLHSGTVRSGIHDHLSFHYQQSPKLQKLFAALWDVRLLMIFFPLWMKVILASMKLHPQKCQKNEDFMDSINKAVNESMGSKKRNEQDTTSGTCAEMPRNCDLLFSERWQWPWNVWIGDLGVGGRIWSKVRLQDKRFVWRRITKNGRVFVDKLVFLYFTQNKICHSKHFIIHDLFRLQKTEGQLIIMDYNQSFSNEKPKFELFSLAKFKQLQVLVFCNSVIWDFKWLPKNWKHSLVGF